MIQCSIALFIASSSYCRVTIFSYTAFQVYRWRKETIRSGKFAAERTESFEDDKYYPTTGTETFISSLSGLRSLLPSEYELIFGQFIKVKDAAKAKKWPGDEDVINKTLAWVESTRTEHDVDVILK